MKRFMVSVLFCLFFAPLFSQGVEKGLETITEQSIRGQLEFLASDWMEGREAGEKGAYLAADYIASMFKVYGIEPVGDNVSKFNSRYHRSVGIAPQKYRSYFQKFNMIKYKPSENQSLSLVKVGRHGTNRVAFQNSVDFTAWGNSVSIDIDAPMVFVGYGIVDSDNGYDDFSKVNVDGKVILRIKGFPGHRDTMSVAYKKFGGDTKLREYRSQLNGWAKERGAVAVIELDSNPGVNFGEPSNLPFRYRYGAMEFDHKFDSYYSYRMHLPGDSLNSGFPTIKLSARVHNEITRIGGIDIDAFEEKLSRTGKPDSKEISGLRVEFASEVEHQLVAVRNVLGMIEGKNKDECIVVGAHYDHCGKYNGYIWNGADDNASGTVAVMSLARAIAESGEKPEKSIIFAAWTAEERGLYGSTYFVDNVPNGMKVIYNQNFDMISRDAPNDSLGNVCGMGYTNAYGGLAELAKRNNRDYDIGLKLRLSGQDKPRGGSDYAPFAAVDIPVTYFMAASHPDYHLPSDEVSKVNWEKVVKVVKLGYLNLLDIANSTSMDEFRVE